MNVRYALSLFVLFISFLILGGCATPTNDPFYPVFSMSIVNNTEAVLDIEVLGRVKKQKLHSGDTYVHELFADIRSPISLVDLERSENDLTVLLSYDLHSFRKGDKVTLIAKGYDSAGHFLGIAQETVSLGREGWHECPVWVVSELVPPTKIGGVAEGKKGE